MISIDREDIERAVEEAEEHGKGYFSRWNPNDDDDNIAVLILTGEYASYGFKSLLALEVLLEALVDLP